MMPSGEEKNHRTEGVPIQGIMVHFLKIQIHYISKWVYEKSNNPKKPPTIPVSIWVGMKTSNRHLNILQVNRKGFACSGRTLCQYIGRVTTLICGDNTYVSSLFFQRWSSSLINGFLAGSTPDGMSTEEATQIQAKIQNHRPEMMTNGYNKSKNYTKKNTLIRWYEQNVYNSTPLATDKDMEDMNHVMVNFTAVEQPLLEPEQGENSENEPGEEIEEADNSFGHTDETIVGLIFLKKSI